ncbi:hypothetical protein G9A89_003845 [Geosiphon pyriformis]|nr:hypothetical protein G9A89_003845 [Geosiphon pyriformis]
MLDWTTQELQLSQNNQHTCISTMCTDADHNKLSPILFWNKNSKGKQREEFIWDTDDLTWKTTRRTYLENKQLDKEDKRKEKKKKEEITQATRLYSSYAYLTLQPSNYSHVVITIRNTTQRQNYTAAHAYSNTLDDQNDRENRITPHYTILINDWVQKRTSIDDVWKQVLRRLEGYPHDEHEIWRMMYAMAEGATASELWEIKTNLLSLPEPEYVAMFNVFGNIEDDSEEFHEHYQ